ncbi:2-keto-4-pentenoate hydratase/2-oxohepta-3-ene-1,7-dioic acid hydratase in catechol pathway [Rhodococcus sp. OK519]|uniref:fumarylacetoacetate hydrolase family protein n=1 Tax=Rhodococcus sp. OK519 TaxID=2135729 RepID=UPI000D348A2F|nr:2-keto-4-pentenoate hydratase/2-oxohepta-3-ene-1,7-dioic acid hydratase in catechol pathway [Rhodococcus sp. OK519]
MRIANLAGRAVLIDGDRAVDVHTASAGRFGPDPVAIFAEWDAFTDWAATTTDVEVGVAFDRRDLGAPSPAPAQVFAIGLNYRDHAAETGLAAPDAPPTFTKFASCLTGPETDLALPTDTVDWEVELVAVIGREATDVATDDAWSHIAGLTTGQDFSERTSQMAGPAPQFSLAKSFPGFGPTGPWLVTPDEFADPNDLAIECAIDGETVQSGRTAQMIFPVAELIAHVSAVCTLRPGDLIFTGTPAGVGVGRSPQRFLAPGNIVTSSIEGIGPLVQRCVPGAK